MEFELWLNENKTVAYYQNMWNYFAMTWSTYCRVKPWGIIKVNYTLTRYTVLIWYSSDHARLLEGHYWVLERNSCWRNSRAADAILSVPSYTTEVERTFSIYFRFIIKSSNTMGDSTVRMCNMVYFNFNVQLAIK